MGGEAPLRGLGLALVEPRASPAEGLPGGHGIQERGGRVTEEQQREVFPPHEALSHRVNEHPQQPVEVPGDVRSEEHTSELQSLAYLVCRLLLEKKKKELTNQ